MLPLLSQRFAMPDLLRCDPDALPLFQCFEIDPVEPKSDDPSACHSPGKKIGMKEKGTPAIRRAFAELKREIGLRGFLMGNVPNAVAIRRRGKCWFFVDKISTIGGIGKSGLEGMMAGTITLCDLRQSRLNGYYADCPALDCRSRPALKDYARQIVGDEGYREALRGETLAWAQRLRMRPTIDYVMRSLAW
jgi:hypothetical protein